MLKVSSPAFMEGERIPADVNPPLEISGMPGSTKSLVLIMDDPDAPVGTWTHWLVWNIDPQTTHVAENSTPVGAMVGVNDFGHNNYGGPCPPSGTHRYFFKIFALDTILDLPASAKRADLDAALLGHVIDKSELMGKYNSIQ